MSETTVYGQFAHRLGLSVLPGPVPGRTESVRGGGVDGERRLVQRTSAGPEGRGGGGKMWRSIGDRERGLMS
jgi:hypothetical protein